MHAGLPELRPWTAVWVALGGSPVVSAESALTPDASAHNEQIKTTITVAARLEA